MVDMSKMNLGRVSVKISAQVGDAERYDLGIVSVPLKVRRYPEHSRGLVIDLDEPFEAIKAMVQQVFGEDT